MKSKYTTALLLLLATGAAKADMTFSVTFTAQALIDLSAAEQALFTDGIALWDSVIVDHRDGISRSWNLSVDTINQAASGGSVLLGSAGPSGLILSNVVAGSGLSAPWTDQFILSSGGTSSFNVHPDAGALQADTIAHEIGHALGIGTLWEDNEVHNDEVAGNHNRTLAGGIAGQYTGAAALAAYQAEFDADATFIPVEQSGGPGTANGHWNESDDFGQTLTGVTDTAGNDMRDELMTGWASPNPDFLSITTIQSLYDIGFNVIVPVPAPEPSGTILLAISSFGFILRRRR